MVLPSKNYKPHCFEEQVKKYYQVENTDHINWDTVTTQKLIDKYLSTCGQVDTTNYIIL